jgi:hypothetical protein
MNCKCLEGSHLHAGKRQVKRGINTQTLTISVEQNDTLRFRKQNQKFKHVSMVKLLGNIRFRERVVYSKIILSVCSGRNRNPPSNGATNLGIRWVKTAVPVFCRRLSKTSEDSLASDRAVVPWKG